jgi:hypothetical protein
VAVLVSLLGVLAVQKVISFGGHDVSSDWNVKLRFLMSLDGLQCFLGACWNRFIRPEAWLEFFHPLGWTETYLNSYHLTLIQISVLLSLLLDSVEIGPALLLGAWQRKGRAFGIAAFLLGMSLLLIGIACFFLYLSNSPLRSRIILGFQMRYLFPVVIFALFLPLALVTDNNRNAPNDWIPVEVKILNKSIVICLFPLLFVARLIELVTDLLIRYSH